MRKPKAYKLAGHNNRLLVKKVGRQIGAVLYAGNYGLAINDVPFIAALIRNGSYLHKPQVIR